MLLSLLFCCVPKLALDLDFFCWFFWGCYSKNCGTELLRENWRAEQARFLVEQFSGLFFPLFVSEMCFSSSIWDLRKTFHHLSVICKKNFGGGDFFLWEKKFGWMSTSRRKLGPRYFGDRLWFCLPWPFLPKLRHIVSEFLKISILTCPRWGIQKHLLILETLAYSIEILAAVKVT